MRGARVNRTVQRESYQQTTPKGSAWRFDFENGIWLGNTGIATNAVIPPTTPAGGGGFGTALAVEANPTNLASVPADRRLTMTPTRTGLATSGATISIRAYGQGVTSSTLTVSYWIYDSFSATWINFGTVAGTFTATGFLTLTAVSLTMNFFGALSYVQVQANAGAAPYMGVSIN